MLKRVSSFACLNVTQFLTALNDNLYKLLLIFFLISLLGAERSNTILAVAGAVFVVPFILFATLAGSLADRLSKRSLIYFTRITEILTTCFGVLAFAFKSIIGGYAILFLMAVQSALFSPCKYGIIPELVPKTKISHCNGVITATTYLAIITGTFFASFLTEITKKNFTLAISFCVLIALLGLISSLGIEKTKPQAERKKVSIRFISDIFRALRVARQHRYLMTTLIFGGYFLFMGSYTQLNIIPFALQSLHLSEVHGGYLFLMTAIGIGMGSYLAGQSSGREVELGFVPLASIGVMFCFFGLYFFESHFFVVVPLLMLIGFFGGFYIVPIESFIQLASPDENRGQNVATANFMNFVGVIFSSGLLALLGNGFGLTAAQGFCVLGFITLLMGIGLLLLFADQVLRLIVAGWARLFLRIEITGRIDKNRAALLVAPGTSWLDTLIVMATLPRLIRYIFPVENGKKSHTFFYHLLWLIPIDIKHFSPIGPPALEAIRKELASGHPVCLMHPVDFPSQTLQEWEHKLKELLKNIDAPIVPIHVCKPLLHPQKTFFSHLKSLKKGVIRVSYGQETTRKS